MNDFNTIITAYSYMSQLRVFASLTNCKIIDAIDRGADIKVPDKKLIVIFDPTETKITEDLVNSYESSGHAIGQFITTDFSGTKSYIGFYDLTNDKKYLWNEHLYTEFLKKCLQSYNIVNICGGYYRKLAIPSFSEMCFCCEYATFLSIKHLLPYAHRISKLSDTRFPNLQEDDILVTIYDNADKFHLVVLENEADVNQTVQTFSSVERFIISLPIKDREELTALLKGPKRKHYDFLFIEAVNKLLTADIKSEEDFVIFGKSYKNTVGSENTAEIWPVLRFLANCILANKTDGEENNERSLY